jgi:hypothetical protein
MTLCCSEYYVLLAKDVDVTVRICSVDILLALLYNTGTLQGLGILDQAGSYWFPVGLRLQTPEYAVSPVFLQGSKEH